MNTNAEWRGDIRGRGTVSTFYKSRGILEDLSYIDIHCQLGEPPGEVHPLEGVLLDRNDTGGLIRSGRG